MFANINHLMILLSEEKGFGALAVLESHLELRFYRLASTLRENLAAIDITSKQTNVDPVFIEAETLNFKF